MKQHISLKHALPNTGSVVAEYVFCENNEEGGVPQSHIFTEHTGKVK